MIRLPALGIINAAVVAKLVILGILFSIPLTFALQSFSIVFTFVSSILYTVFLTTSFFTALLRLLRSIWTVFSLSTSILSTSVFNLPKSDFTSRLDVSNSAALFKSAFLQN